MTNLRVNEIFGPTFQGEGRSMGMPCHFLRLAGCNLHCSWCDTWYTWNFGKGDGETRFGSPTVKMADESHQMSVEEVADKLKDCQNLVISGGEPMLQQQALMALIPLLTHVKHIEIETNGTVPLIGGLKHCIEQINCSPKLASSGNTAIRYQPQVLKQYQVISQ